MQGWRVQILSGCSDNTLEILLGLKNIKYFNEVEREYPGVLAIVYPYSNELALQKFSISEDTISQIAKGQWNGNANVNSYGHNDWAVIKAVNSATVQTTDQESTIFGPITVKTKEGAYSNTSTVLASVPIRTRRSALEFNGKEITLEQFQQFLLRVYFDFFTLLTQHRCFQIRLQVCGMLLVKHTPQ
jgi:hypothetical protein